MLRLSKARDWVCLLKLRFQKTGPIILLAKVSVGAEDRFFRLLFDTGAARTILSRRRLTSFTEPLNLTGDSFEIVTANGKEVLNELSLNSVGIREMEKPGFRVLAHDLPEEAHVDGLLGWDFFSGTKLNIDFDSGVFEWVQA